ncbi:hypothetical protein AAMO2058_001115300, partial [Amorphochlora amoebiformis]
MGKKLGGGYQSGVGTGLVWTNLRVRNRQMVAIGRCGGWDEHGYSRFDQIEESGLSDDTVNKERKANDEKDDILDPNITQDEMKKMVHDPSFKEIVKNPGIIDDVMHRDPVLRKCVAQEPLLQNGINVNKLRDIIVAGAEGASENGTTSKKFLEKCEALGKEMADESDTKSYHQNFPEPAFPPQYPPKPHKPTSNPKPNPNPTRNSSLPPSLQTRGGQSRDSRIIPGTQGHALNLSEENPQALGESVSGVQSRNPGRKGGNPGIREEEHEDHENPGISQGNAGEDDVLISHLKGISMERRNKSTLLGVETKDYCKNDEIADMREQASKQYERFKEAEVEGY